MVMEHTAEMLSSFDAGETMPVGFFQHALEFSWEFMCTDFFLILIGFGFVFTRKNSAGQMLRRGVRLLVVAMGLNIVRLVIPYTIFSLVTGCFDFSEFLYYLFIVDILHLAAVSYMFSAFIAWLNISRYLVLPIGVILQIIAALIVPSENMGFALRTFANFFVAVDDSSFFPFLSYFVYIAAGMIFGTLVIEKSFSDRFYKNLIVISAVALAGILFSCHLDGIDLTRYYDQSYTFRLDETYNTSFLSLLIASMVFFIVYGLFHFIHQLIGDNGKLHFFSSFCGKKLTIIYMIHWVILGWVGIIFEMFEFEYLPLGTALTTGLVVAGISMVLAKVLPDLKLTSIR